MGNGLDLEYREYATAELMLAIKLDLRPSMPTRLVFGIADREHFEAVRRPVLEGEITQKQLEHGMGNGKELTGLVNATRANPHSGIEFITAWDGKDTPKVAPVKEPVKRKEKNLDLER